jgi:GrpB-like predicted nucleotidyltransferase (UPF0157 family)
MLVWSDDLLDQAQQTRDAVADVLQSLGVAGDLVVTGAASISGVLTKGDIDLHLRVGPGSFSDVVAMLTSAYPRGSLHSWAPTLAVFDVPGPRPTGLAVTPADSEHDRRFREAWRRLRADPGLRNKYNEMKFLAADTASYEEQKSDFFSQLTQT